MTGSFFGPPGLGCKARGAVGTFSTCASRYVVKSYAKINATVAVRPKTIEPHPKRVYLMPGCRFRNREKKPRRLNSSDAMRAPDAAAAAAEDAAAEAAALTVEFCALGPEPRSDESRLTTLVERCRRDASSEICDDGCDSRSVCLLCRAINWRLAIVELLRLLLSKDAGRRSGRFATANLCEVILHAQHLRLHR